MDVVQPASLDGLGDSTICTAPCHGHGVLGKQTDNATGVLLV